MSLLSAVELDKMPLEGIFQANAICDFAAVKELAPNFKGLAGSSAPVSCWEAFPLQVGMLQNTGAKLREGMLKLCIGAGKSLHYC